MMLKSKTSNTSKIKFLKIGIFLFPLVLVSLVVLDKVLFEYQSDYYLSFAEEDGPVEFGTAIFYFLSFVFSGVIGATLFKQKRNFFAILYLVLSALFLFVAFEEISWAQRIFQVDTPEYFMDNMQNEMNFHNLPIMDGYKRLSIWLVAVSGFTLWVVFAHYDKLKDKPFTKFFTPQGFTMPYFISVVIYHGIDLFEINHLSDRLSLYFFTWPDVEVYEFLLSAGIFIFVASKFIELKNQKTPNLKVNSSN